MSKPSNSSNSSSSGSFSGSNSCDISAGAVYLQSDSMRFMQGVKSVKDIDLQGRRVLIRVDFNVPMDKSFNISDDTRIREALPTINYCIDSSVSSIVLVSHLGRPKGRSSEFSLKHILKRLERLLNRSVIFADSIESAQGILDSICVNELQDSNAPKDCVSKAFNSQYSHGSFTQNYQNETQNKAHSNKKQTNIILLENIRFYDGESKNDIELSKKLALLCDIYVNDAFGTSHRKHVSTYGIAEFVKQKVAGILLKKEIDSFAKVIHNPLRPLLLIVGGSKVSSKLSLLQRVLDVVDKIIIGGAMSNTFLKALGFDMQKSLVENDLVGDATKILESAKQKGVKIYLPVDIVSTTDINAISDIRITPAQDMPENFIATDIGPASVRLFSEVVTMSQTIIWNGPLGIYEISQFSRGTFNIAHTIANTYAFSFIGGGDTADAIDKAGQRDNMSFISTGGGASLELLEGNVLPAFEVLERI